MADDENERLAHAEYWDQRYAETGGDEQVHEWFRTFGDLGGFFDKYLFQTFRPETRPLLMHLGSGDSTIPQDLAKRGYHNQLCVDFSSVVVDRMTTRHADLGLSQSIRWDRMDVRHMESVASGSVDVAFDKGTLDAMIHGSPWSPPEDTIQNTGAYMREVMRVLNPDRGIFLYVTYRQPHFVRPLLECEGTDWDVEIELLGASEGSFGYHGILCRPRKKSSKADESQETSLA